MMSQLGPLAAVGSAGVTVFYLLLALLFFYPSLKMFRFSNKTKQGVLFGEQEPLNEAFSNIKSLFKFWGILIIVIVIAYFILVMAVATGGVKI